jgi:hypothetical protein
MERRLLVPQRVGRPAKPHPDTRRSVARIRLKKVAVLNYLGAGTRAYNIDRVERAMKPRGDQGQEPLRARIVMGESQKIVLTQGSIYASIDTVRHIGRPARDKKAGECDQFACAIVEELLASEDCQEQAPRIEILGNGGHAFVVVNRRESSDLNDIDGWDRAIFVDVWSFSQGVLHEPVYWGERISKPARLGGGEYHQESFRFRGDRLAHCLVRR